MDLQAFVSLIRRRWPIVVLAFVVCLTSSAALSASQTKQYSATARMFVSVPDVINVSQAVQAVQLTSDLMQSYAKMVDANITTGRVANRLSGRIPAAEIRGKVSAAAIPQTLLIDVKGGDSSPSLAADLTNQTAEALRSVIDQLGKPSGIEATIISRASVPSKPVSPQPARDLAVGSFLGLALGLAVALAMDALDRTIREEEVASEIFGAPVLCSIPKQRNLAADPLVALKPGGSPTGEAYRALRTAIRFRESAQALKTVLVTSAAAGDGKSTIASNLAIAMSLDGARTILIDADLRRTRLNSIFDIEPGPGLTEVLLGKMPLEDALVPFSRGLSILQVGNYTLNPSEALGSQVMVKVLEEAKRLADIVIVDAPPILPVADPAVLAALVDGTVIVCRWHRTSLHAAGSTRSMLDNVGADVIGVVLNAEGGGRSNNYYRHYSNRPQHRRGERQPAAKPASVPEASANGAGNGAANPSATPGAPAKDGG
ncbi:MAG TPA: polysaccharide biosynthesis tyrosine autokinase [Acidimicrobiales bacterium]|nr:polysaccharide biosynthesis tyrosine autokinase [Acidimicrobiales bacterium]